MTIDTATAKACALQQGWADYLAGNHTNPFSRDTRHHTDWQRGHDHSEDTYSETQHLEPSHVA